MRNEALRVALSLALAAPALAGDDVLVRLPPGQPMAIGEARAVRGALGLYVVPADRCSLLPSDAQVYPNPRCAAASGPDDPLFPVQEHLAVHDAETVWASQAEAEGVVVAVLDTGVAYENYTDPLGTYGLASDLVGTSFLPGYDFVNEDSHPNDDHHHGTFVAALVAETTDNGLGGAGLARGATILPVKVLDAHGNGALSDVLEGIYFATDQGADIILMAFAFPPGLDPGPPLDDALAYARSRGVLLIGAAGNGGAPLVSHPAASPLVIAVGAAKTTSMGGVTRAAYSNFGTALDVIAFGGDGADRDGNLQPDAPLAAAFLEGAPLVDAYYFLGGTSAAAATVAGTAALMLAAGADPEDVPRFIHWTAQDLELPGFDTGTGFGLLDAAAAVDAAQAHGCYEPPQPRVVVRYVLQLSGGTWARLRADIEVTIGGWPLPLHRVFGHFRGVFHGTCGDDLTDFRGKARITSPWIDISSENPASWIPGESYALDVDRVIWSWNRYDPTALVPVEPLPGADVLIDHPIRD